MIELDERFIDRLPGELSGGQKQRIGIARALAMNPELIICDEVTSALDQIVAEGILKLLLRLQKQLNVSYLYITHDLATVKAIVGAKVSKGDLLLTMEAMKMETSVRAETDGTVAEVLVKPGLQVDAKDLLVVLS